MVSPATEASPLPLLWSSPGRSRFPQKKTPFRYPCSRVSITLYQVDYSVAYGSVGFSLGWVVLLQQVLGNLSGLRVFRLYGAGTPSTICGNSCNTDSGSEHCQDWKVFIWVLASLFRFRMTAAVRKSLSRLIGPRLHPCRGLEG